MCPLPSWNHTFKYVDSRPTTLLSLQDIHTQVNRSVLSLQRLMAIGSVEGGTLTYMPTGKENHSFGRQHSLSYLMPQGFLWKEAGFAHQPGCCFFFFSKRFPPPQQGWELYRGQTKPFLLPITAARVVEVFRDRLILAKWGIQLRTGFGLTLGNLKSHLLEMDWLNYYANVYLGQIYLCKQWAVLRAVLGRITANHSCTLHQARPRGSGWAREKCLGKWDCRR